MNALAWFSIFVVGAATAELGYWWLRRYFQDRIDMSHSTYELVLPYELALDSAARIFTSISGLYKYPGKYGETWGRPTIVFELLGTPRGLHYLISFPSELETSVRGHLLGVVPNLGMTEVVSPVRNWTLALELRRHPANTMEANEKLVPVLLGAMRELHDQEAVMAQFVMVSTGNGLAGEEGDPFYVTGRIAASAHDIRARELLRRVLVAYRSLGVFSAHPLPKRATEAVAARRAPLASWPSTLSAAGLAVVCGLPIGSPQVPGLVLGAGRKLLAAPAIPTQGFVVGTSTYPGNLRPLALDAVAAMQHQWVLGGTGAGKSTLLHNEAVQIMEQGHGLIVIEPKGDLARDIRDSVPKSRLADVVWFDPTDLRHPIGLNVLDGADPERTASFITGLMKSLYGDSWGPRLEWILRWSVLTAAMNGLTLYDVKQLLTNAEYRQRVVRATKDPEVKAFWRRLDTGADNQVDAVINKLDAFVGFSSIRNIVGQKTGLSIRDIVRENKILLIPLDEKRLEENNVSMLGSIIVSQIWSEIGIRPVRLPTFLMLDEFHRFLRMSLSVEDALAQARSYQLGLILANQSTSQLKPPSLLSAMRANARTKIVFGLEDEDAGKLAPNFSPLNASDLKLLGQYEVAVSMMTPDGLAPVATAKTLTAPRPTGHGGAIAAASRALYGRPVEEVEAEFAERFKSVHEERERPAIGRRPRTP